MNKHLLAWLLAVLLLITSPNVLAADETCVGLPKADRTGYLDQSTAYGHVKHYVYMKTRTSGGCELNGDVLKFCIGDPNCTRVEMSLGDTARLGDLNNDQTLGGDPLLADIELSVNQIGSSLCLTMPTSLGAMPIVCRAYNTVQGVANGTETAVCTNIGASCFRGQSKSQSLLSFSGTAVTCVKETLDKVFYTGNQCPQVDRGIQTSSLNVFPSFLASMRLAVTGALILYVMFYGFKLVMDNDYANLDKVALFIIKFIFVVYFAVGFNQFRTTQNGVDVNRNGVTEYLLPLALGLSSNLTEFIFGAGGSQGLCSYDSSRYETGYEYYKMWDAIDCRVGYYFGMQLLYNLDSTGIFSSLNEVGNSGTVGNPINFGNPSHHSTNTPWQILIFSTLYGFLLAGNIAIVACGVVFAVIFLSIIFYFLNVYLLCLVTLYVMAYISPIFVPMVLFEKTKQYFDSWLKIIISCVLQPAVVAGFIALLLTIYDSTFYGNCQYLRHDYQSSGNIFSTFELRTPDTEPEKCTSSIGYKLQSVYLGAGLERVNLILFEITKINDVVGLLASFVSMLVFLLIFYFMLSSVSEFAADLTGGPIMAGVAISPTAFMEKAAAAASKLKSMMSKGDKNSSLGSALTRPAARATGARSGSGQGVQSLGQSQDAVSTGSSLKSQDAVSTRDGGQDE